MSDSVGGQVHSIFSLYFSVNVVCMILGVSLCFSGYDPFLLIYFTFLFAVGLIIPDAFEYYKGLYFIIF